MEKKLSGGGLTKYKAYIEKRGAVVLDSLSPLELVRFTIYGELNIIFKNKDEYEFVGNEAERSFRFWNKNLNWTPPNRKRQQLTSRKLKIANRDGMMCFFCAEPHNDTKHLTIEHLLSFKHGGTDNINNLALACDTCNREAGTKSLAEKIRLRDHKLGIKKWNVDFTQ